METCLCLSLLIFVLSFVCALPKSVRRKKSLSLMIVFTGTLIAIGITAYPVIDTPGEYGEYKLLHTIFYLIKVVGGQYDPKFTQEIGHYRFWHAFLMFLHILVPLLSGAILLSLFSRVLNFCRYRLFRFGKQIYLFSELNPRSVAMAGNISRSGQRCLIIFCNADSPTSNNQEEEYENEFNWIFIKDNELNVYARLSKHDITFFQLSMDEQKNLSMTMKIADVIHKQAALDNIEIYTASTLSESEVMLDAFDKHGLNITLINEDQFIIYKLLNDHPLYLPKAQPNQALSILIVGGGKIGCEALRALTWCGIFPERKTVIRMIDADMPRIQSMLADSYPELVNGNYDLSFFQAVAGELDFKNVLCQHCADSQYIIVALGDDDLSIKTAIYLREHFLRESYDFGNKPQIYMRVTDKNRSKVMKQQHQVTNKNSYGIVPFGSNDEIYSTQILNGSQFERLAGTIHNAYEAQVQKEFPEYKGKRYADLREVLKRSNQAAALHIQYKLNHFGLEMIPVEKGDDSAAAEQAGWELFSQRLAEEDIETLADWEHQRWMAFQRSQGYRSMSLERAKALHVQKNDTAKLHACIRDYKDLPLLSAIFDGRDFCESDRVLFTWIPDLLKGQYLIQEQKQD